MAGIGTIPKSGLQMRSEYAAFDASQVFGLAELWPTSLPNASVRRCCKG